MKSFERLVLAHLKDITGPLLDPLQFAYLQGKQISSTPNSPSSLYQPAPTCQWFSNFLTDRRQQIEEEFRRITLKPLQSTFLGKLDQYTPKLLSWYRRKVGATGKKLDETLDLLNEAWPLAPPWSQAWGWGLQAAPSAWWPGLCPRDPAGLSPKWRKRGPAFQ
ncbi:hypothetical protein L3Q82_000717 [Scortum barcoo]|uniref:Uncharacterized protein n=1 Tax=Scortum barcoo TaxID=214431 RepID=A0ACB8WCR0_9TELE|nr:hypothetical protein L3Q82_000717 [Scortum barcoo]